MTVTICKESQPGISAAVVMGVTPSARSPNTSRKIAFRPAIPRVSEAITVSIPPPAHGTDITTSIR